MIKRTIEISQQPAHLSVRNGQLLIRSANPLPDGRGSEIQDRGSEIQDRGSEIQDRGSEIQDRGAPDAPADGVPSRRGVRARLAEESRSAASIPCEDVGVLIVDQPAVTYSHAALVELIAHNAAVVLCGRDHLPAGLLLPLGGHTQVVPRLHMQIAVGKPLCKRLWQQIVQAKVRAQAHNLPDGADTRSKLLALARVVRSGDPTNVEAQAARAYWSAFRGLLDDPDFRRDPDGPAPNHMLNYGYAVMRAAVARAIVAAGLLPALGIHHCNRSDAFCLADDLVEPLRPMVDVRVLELTRAGEKELEPEVKRHLLELLTVTVRIAEQTGPLMVALHGMVASLVHCMEGSAKRLDIPVLCES